MRLIFATNNMHKFSEIVEILGEKYKDFVFVMKDLGININPDENGNSFIENSKIKAIALYDEMKKNNLIKPCDYIISDDTGLCIDYLNGAPGIHSARFMGINKTQEEKNNMILEMMKDVEMDRRKAFFKTVLTVIEVGNNINEKYKLLNFEGQVDGYIAKKNTGSEGFGYDPIFAVGDPIDNLIIDNTYANLGLKEKNKISHRAVALNKFTQYLEKNHNI